MDWYGVLTQASDLAFSQGLVVVGVPSAASVHESFAAARFHVVVPPFQVGVAQSRHGRWPATLLDVDASVILDPTNFGFGCYCA